MKVDKHSTKVCVQKKKRQQHTATCGIVAVMVAIFTLVFQKELELMKNFIRKAVFCSILFSLSHNRR